MLWQPYNEDSSLEVIDNSNPSEALEWLDKSKNMMIENNGDFIAFDCLKVYSVCKQALLEAQELERLLDHERELNNHLILKTQKQEKVLEIIFEKGLSLAERDMIKQSENYEQYQIKISWWNYKPFAIPKSKEEFDTLKRYLGDE